ncbi:MAG TPA: aldehyde dehydrogenase, partial [Spirochaetaceae bacterium]|nr:aldehyde dehydrogenase [Spirochaetaceae bacterium]
MEPRSGLYYPDANPADDGDVIGEFALSGDEDAAAAILSADRAFKSWSGLTVARREAYIERFASLIAENRLRIGEAICREEGKTLKEAMGEPDRGVEECRYFIGEGRRLEGIT